MSWNDPIGNASEGRDLDSKPVSQDNHTSLNRNQQEQSQRSDKQPKDGTLNRQNVIRPEVSKLSGGDSLCACSGLAPSIGQENPASMLGHMMYDHDAPSKEREQAGQKHFTKCSEHPQAISIHAASQGSTKISQASQASGCGVYVRNPERRQAHRKSNRVHYCGPEGNNCIKGRSRN